MSAPLTRAGWGLRLWNSLVGPRLAVYALAILFVLTFWGTLYQVDHGLYAAQERFYRSWFFLVGGYVPVPGAQLALALLTLNLTAYLVSKRGRFPFGILLTHAGLLLMLIGGGITRYFAEESQLTLAEGETSNVSSSYHHWELAAWRQDGAGREVLAATSDALRPGDLLRFPEAGLAVTVEQYHRNARAFRATAPQADAPQNARGITSLKPARLEKDPVGNLPGALLTVQPAQGEPVRLLLFGEEAAPAAFAHDGAEWHLGLRRLRTPLPFAVTLLDFVRELHPGTTMAKAFSSKVVVKDDRLERTMTISMNKPLRDRGYTLYQASYSELPGQPQMSTFAVARNYGRLIPYVSTGVIVAGMIWHFLTVLVRRVRAT